MKILLVHFASKGLLNDAIILYIYINKLFQSLEFEVTIEILSTDAPEISYSEHDQSFTYPNEIKPDVVIHIQDIYEIKNLAFDEAQHILLPNPEWTNQHTAKRVHHINAIWHKTYYSQRAFLKAFVGAKVEHYYLGFTTIDRNLRVNNFNSFAHFRGAGVARNTDKIFDIWKRRSDYPLLRVKFHSGDRSLVFLNCLSWFRVNNIEIKHGFSADDEEYFSELTASGGLHLCTSEMEGFGHYINESRMLGAVPVVINGFPMSELVDSNSGFLVQPNHTESLNLSLRYKITEDALEKIIDTILGETQSTLEKIGQNARERYDEDRRSFISHLYTACKHIRHKYETK